MKKFKEFKLEQQVISEVGPIGAVMMGAMGLFGAWKAFKGVKDKITGWKESKAEKKANRESGVDIEIKKLPNLVISQIVWEDENGNELSSFSDGSVGYAKIHVMNEGSFDILLKKLFLQKK